ncbi:MAG: MBL fold metallo-hydrolase [Acidobacteriota bacterium]
MSDGAQSEDLGLTGSPTDIDHEAFYRALLGAAPPPAPQIRASCSIVPWRRSADGLEVFWVRRSPTLRFMGGFWAFPGGGRSRGDANDEAALVDATSGAPSGTTADAVTDPGPDAEPAVRDALEADLAPGVVTAGLRELFEEVGLLPFVGATDRAARIDGRRRLLAGDVSFAQLVLGSGWRLDLDRLAFAGRWLTPPFAPRRFDNRFFLLRWRSEDGSPRVDHQELDRGEWIAPERALERWRAGEIAAAPPTIHLLRVLAEDGPEAGSGRLLDTSECNLGPLRRIEFLPGALLIPLRTPTLPPATHTNAFVIGRERAVLIDPSTPFEDEQKALFEALDALRAEGREVAEIWLTHHHPDHVGAAAVARRRLGVPIRAHQETADRLRRGGLTVDGTLDDGEHFELGMTGDPWPLEVVYTPGHARGHLAFFDERHRTLIAGDLASTLSTIVIDPPEGDMDAYLASLERAIALEPRALFPAHGPVTLRAVELLRELRDHRLEREAATLAAVRDGQRRAEEIVPVVYPDLPPAVRPIAARQIQAHLERLRRQGQI